MSEFKIASDEELANMNSAELNAHAWKFRDAIKSGELLGYGPRMYDITIDDRRPATQSDIDTFHARDQAMGAYLIAQKALREAFLAVASNRMDWRKFHEAIKPLQELVGGDKGGF